MNKLSQIFLLNIMFNCILRTYPSVMVSLLYGVGSQRLITKQYSIVCVVHLHTEHAPPTTRSKAMQ